MNGILTIWPGIADSSMLFTLALARCFSEPSADLIIQPECHESSWPTDPL